MGFVDTTWNQYVGKNSPHIFFQQKDSVIVSVLIDTFQDLDYLANPSVDHDCSAHCHKNSILIDKLSKCMKTSNPVFPKNWVVEIQLVQRKSCKIYLKRTFVTRF